MKSLTCVVLAQSLIATIDFVVLGPDALQSHGFLLSWAPRLFNFIECCYPEPRVLLKLLNYPWGNLSLGSHDPQVIHPWGIDILEQFINGNIIPG